MVNKKKIKIFAKQTYTRKVEILIKKEVVKKI